MISNAAIKIDLLLEMRFNSTGLINRLQQQQIWSMSFTPLMILTRRQLIAFCIVASDSLGEKTIHISVLRRKSSPKVTGSTSTLLAIGSASLMFADGGVHQHWRWWALQGGINLFNGVLGAELLFVRGGQGIRVSTFEGGFKTFLVDICSCLRAKDLRGEFGISYCLQLQQEKVKLFLRTRRGRGNPFILVNNVVAEFLDHCNRFYSSL